MPACGYLTEGANSPIFLLRNGSREVHSVRNREPEPCPEVVKREATKKDKQQQQQPKKSSNEDVEMLNKVEQQLQQRGRSDVAPEEQLLDRIARHVAQGGQQLEQRPVPVGRPWPAGTDILVRDQQLAEVDWREVLGHGQDEELAPRLLEQHQLVRHRELRERGQALEEVDVHEEQLGGRLPDRVDRDERMGRRHASCPGEQGRRWQIRTGGRCRRWRRQERVAPERQIQPHRRLLVMVMVVPVMMMVMMGMVVAGVRDRDAGR
uniref:Uncharacterized protein n=1 Tax=Anopheles coluzzii TaxID=1518534 RepID=A0A8W7PR53_ANOCL